MLKNNLESVFSLIKNGNNYNEPITLVGATKMVDVETINQAVELGLKVVAENKVQEFREKHLSISSDCEQQFIGHLQTNKIKYIAGNVSLIQSIDSIHLAEELNAFCSKKQIVQNVLAEINVGGELSKSGFDFSNVHSSVKELSKFSNLNVVGLMAMLPKTDDDLLLEGLCKSMRKTYDELKNDYGFKFLSMGMSADYKICIANGSNMIRLGSTLFGNRNYEVK